MKVLTPEEKQRHERGIRNEAARLMGVMLLASVLTGAFVAMLAFMLARLL